ncbi:hypothetical protein C7N43_07210 [Sphingobacteriales bacterium UPWRP_1]|nr:hypothetical protein B6N25_04695 [Sphingobacteriales bacterium TSM_CSS]PSJ77767.1 hypothetical protein C7N43_07210 [Sphingobacteriales bacterium UPWRP_1]
MFFNKTLSVLMNLKLLNPTDLKKEGFPEGHVQAFLKTAKDTGNVIMTRTPGGVCEMLLAEDYDGKGFFVKSKSCDWGPMAGFVCLDPLMNKNGLVGAMSNLSASLHALRDKYEGNTAKTTQIVISQQRFDWLRENKAKGATYTKVSDDLYTYESKELSALLMRHKDAAGGSLWYLYYDIKKFYGIKDTKIDKNVSLLDDSIKYPTLQENLPMACIERLKGTEDYQKEVEKSKSEEAAQKKIHEFWALVNKRGCFVSTALAENKEDINGEPKIYFALMALTNPHEPFSGDLKHLNALTGDYDLYAIWPPKSNAGKDDLRIAGMTENIKSNEIVDKENANSIGEVVGNVSQRIFDVGQLINSNMTSVTNKFPNRVFHGDECGRPFVTSVDSAVVFSPNGEIYMIKDAKDMVEMIVHFYNKDYACFINTGWKEQLEKAAQEKGINNIMSMVSWADGMTNSNFNNFNKTKMEELKKADTGTTAKTDSEKKTAEKTEDKSKEVKTEENAKEDKAETPAGDKGAKGDKKELTEEEKKKKAEEEQKKKDEEISKALDEFMKDVRGDIPKLIEKIGEKMGDAKKAAFSDSSNTSVFRVKLNSLEPTQTSDYFKLTPQQQEDLYDRIGFFKGLVVDHTQSEIVQQGFREIFKRTVGMPTDPTSAVKVFYRKPKFSGFYETNYALSEGTHQLQTNGIMNFGCVLNAGGGIGVKVGVSAGYNYGKESMKKTSSHEKKVFISSNFFLPKVELSFDAGRPCASPEFLTAITEALTFDNNNNARFKRLLNVLNDFGHFVPTKLIIGGRLFGTDEKTIKTDAEISDVTTKHSAALKAKVKGIAFQGDAKAEFSMANREQKSNEATEEAQKMEVKAIGGEGALVSDADAWTKSLHDYTAWSLVRYDGMTPSINILPKETYEQCKDVIMDIVNNNHIEDLLDMNAYFLFYSGYNEVFGVHAKRKYFCIQNADTQKLLSIKAGKLDTGLGVEAVAGGGARNTELWWINADGKILSKTSEENKDNFVLSIYNDSLCIALEDSTTNQTWSIAGGQIKNLDKNVFLESTNDVTIVRLNASQPKGLSGVWKILTPDILLKQKIDSHSAAKVKAKPLTNGSNVLLIGQEMAVGGFMQSQNQRFKLILQEDGKLALLDGQENKELWSKSMPNNKANRFFIAENGVLTLEDVEAKAKYGLNSAELSTDFKLQILNNGNMELVDVNDKLIWESDTCTEFFCIKNTKSGFVLTIHYVKNNPRTQREKLCVQPFARVDSQLWYKNSKGQIISKVRHEGNKMMLVATNDSDGNGTVTLNATGNGTIWDMTSDGETTIKDKITGNFLLGYASTASGVYTRKSDTDEGVGKWEFIKAAEAANPIEFRQVSKGEGPENYEKFYGTVLTVPIHIPENFEIGGISLGFNSSDFRHLSLRLHKKGKLSEYITSSVEPFEALSTPTQFARVQTAPVYIPENGALKTLKFSIDTVYNYLPLHHIRLGTEVKVNMQTISNYGNTGAENSENFPTYEGVGYFDTEIVPVQDDERVVAFGLNAVKYRLAPYLFVTKK